MKTLIALGLLVFGSLFLVTTFGSSPEARTRAEPYFTAAAIDNGLQFSFERRFFSWGGIALHLGFLVLLVCTPLGRRVADGCLAWTGGRWLPAVLLVGAFYFLAGVALHLPLAIGRFYHTRSWGLSARSLESWTVDYLKGLGLAAATDSIVLVGIFLLLRWFPRRWWILATVLGSVLGIGYAIILPVVIEPIFNTFTPLGQTEWAPLEPMVRKLVERADVPVTDILVVDASRQGYHSNAYFTGFGATRRIVLYDNLLKKHPPDEIESILAHELGHWLHDHIVKGMGLAAAAALLGFYLLARILWWAQGRGPLALRAPSDPASLFLLLLLVALGQWAAMPVENAVSRHFERQADAVSLELAGQPKAFKTAEVRLATDNISNVAPLPFSVWLFATHPPAVERIQMAEEWEKRHNP